MCMCVCVCLWRVNNWGVKRDSPSELPSCIASSNSGIGSSMKDADCALTPIGGFFFLLCLLEKGEGGKKQEEGARGSHVWFEFVCVYGCFPQKNRQLVRCPVQTAEEVETTGRKVKDLFCFFF